MQSSGQSDQSFISNCSDSKDERRPSHSPQSFYSTSNYSAVYGTPSQGDGWNGAFDYAVFPRTHNKHDLGSKRSREGNSRSKKHDYQDVYKDRKDKHSKRADKSKDSTRSVDSSDKIAPVVPAKHYQPEEEVANPLIYEDLSAVSEAAPPKIAPISGFLAKVRYFIPVLAMYLQVICIFMFVIYFGVWGLAVGLYLTKDLTMFYTI